MADRLMRYGPRYAGDAKLVKFLALFAKPPSDWPDDALVSINAGFEIGDVGLVTHEASVALEIMEAAMVLGEKDTWRLACSILLRSKLEALPDLTTIAPGVGMNYAAILLALGDRAALRAFGARLHASKWRDGVDPDLRGFATIALALSALASDPASAPDLLADLRDDPLAKDRFWRGHIEGFRVLSDAILRLDEAAARDALTAAEAAFQAELEREYKRYAARRRSEIAAANFTSPPIIGMLALARGAGLSLPMDRPFFDLAWIDAAAAAPEQR